MPWPVQLVDRGASPVVQGKPMILSGECRCSTGLGKFVVFFFQVVMEMFLPSRETGTNDGEPTGKGKLWRTPHATSKNLPVTREAANRA